MNQAIRSTLIFAIGFCCSCSSSLKISTEPPDVEVYVSSQNSKEKKLLGKSPIEISYKDLKEKTGGAVSATDMLVFNLESKNFESEKLFVPPSGFGTTVTHLQVKMGEKKEVSNASHILQRLHNAQKFAQSGQFERAHIETDKAIEFDPNFVRALSLKGSIFYLQKNYNESIKWFEKALAIDNSFEEAVKMIAKAKQEMK